MQFCLGLTTQVQRAYCGRAIGYGLWLGLPRCNVEARPSEPAASAAAAPAAAFAAAVPQQLEFRGPEWQRPVRGGELEQLLCIAYWLANAIDRMLGRCPVMTPCGPVPQTEWPRVLGNWKFTLFLTIALLLAVLW